MKAKLRMRSNQLSIGACTCLAVVSAACSITRTQPAIQYFVPPAPKTASPAFVLQEPPDVQPDLFSRELPNLLSRSAPGQARSFEADLRLKQAEKRLQAGTELLIEGRSAEARAEFDAALDLLAGAPAALPERAKLEKRWQQMVEDIYRLEAEAIGQTADEPEPAYDKSPLDEIVELTFPLDPKLRAKVKEQMAATVSQLPLEVNDAVLSYINYFSTTRGKRTISFGLRRSGRYLPMIRRILDEEGLPQELIYLAQAESAFLPRAVSRKRACGMWQFIQSRGEQYGLRKTAGTDDRFDPEMATRAAARHLLDLYTQFGDWYLAMAAYNGGPLTVERAVQRTGFADFWEFRNRNVLPRDTANYVPVILAITIMAKNRKAYGLEDLEVDAPLESSTVVPEAATHLALIAEITQQPLATIREMNPAILKLVAPAGYPVRVPRGTANKVVAALQTVPAEKRASWRLHRVSTADTLAQIARHYRTTEKMIAAANSARTEDLQAGDLLVIPVAYPGSERTKGTSKKTTTARKTSAKKPAVRTSATTSKSASTRPAMAYASAALGSPKQSGAGRR